ncbi:MAG: sulfite exporter TauE/SafE family protein [Dehalococcoidales bacterium]|jgi:hypothetical protein|nr:sulfite exporter TauE/SafE family protein [Sphaerochaeta sp.]MDD5510758.1 sulfite exporter TauE/SafE family protein [Dehalococcoidales bacterium]
MIDVFSIVLLAFVLELIDNGLGGGFGTILSPVLILFGYSPLVVVPAILLSETVSGLWGGGWHAKYKNVDYRMVGLTLVGAVCGMLAASVLLGAYLPATYVKWYISIVAIGMGIFVVIRSYRKLSINPDKKYSKPLTIGLGLLTGFNKGGTGGGYGPLSVSGYMCLGMSAAVAIGTTTVAEGIAAVVGVGYHLATLNDFIYLAIPLAFGAAIADPIGSYINNRLKISLEPPFHGRLIGVAMLGLGTLTIVKLLGWM